MRANAYPRIETLSDYAKYRKIVDQFLADIGQILSRKNYEDEPYFSHNSCDCCQRQLGGSRMDMLDINGNEYSICCDCEYYAEYGQLDDMTMLDMERE